MQIVAVDIVGPISPSTTGIGGFRLFHEMGRGLRHSKPGGSYSGDEAGG